MKKNFITGLALLIPTGLTFIIISLLVNLLTAPFLKFFVSQLNHYTPAKDILLFDNHEMLTIGIQLLIFLFVLAAILLIGMLTRMVFFNYLLHLVDKLAHAIPGFNRIYKSIKEVVHTLFGSQSSPFTHVVLVPFSNTKAHCLGLISSHTHTEEIAVCIPEAANLSTGFIVRYKKEQLIFIDMPVDEAFRTICSCGTIFPSYNVLPPPADIPLETNADA